MRISTQTALLNQARAETFLLLPTWSPRAHRQAAPCGLGRVPPPAKRDGQATSKVWALPLCDGVKFTSWSPICEMGI